MDALFFDSSAVVKRFARESGTAWVLGLFKPSNENILFVARITSVEVVAALAKQGRIENLTQTEFDKSVRRFKRSLQNRFAFVEISESITNEAMDLAEKHELRGYDAVQLAAALKIHRRRIQLNLSTLIFVSADKDLNDAAIIEGLTVENPNNYP